MKKSYIKINNEIIPTPDEIDFEFRDIEGSSSGVTEAGITQRHCKGKCDIYIFETNSNKPVSFKVIKNVKANYNTS